MLVLTPGSASPVFQREAVSPSPVLAAAFLPNARPPALADLAWPGTSQIYLFNADEELITFDVPDLQKKAEKACIASYKKIVIVLILYIDLSLELFVRHGKNSSG